MELLTNQKLLELASIVNYVISITVFLMASRSARESPEGQIGRSGIVLAATVCLSSSMIDYVLMEDILSMLSEDGQWGIRFFMLLAVVQAFRTVRDYDIYYSKMEKS